MLQPNTPPFGPKTHQNPLHHLERSITIAWLKTAPRLDSPSSSYLYKYPLPEIPDPNHPKPSPAPHLRAGHVRSRAGHRRRPLPSRHMAGAVAPAREAQPGPPRPISSAPPPDPAESPAASRRLHAGARRRTRAVAVTAAPPLPRPGRLSPSRSAAAQAAASAAAANAAKSGRPRLSLTPPIYMWEGAPHKTTTIS